MKRQARLVRRLAAANGKRRRRRLRGRFGVSTVNIVAGSVGPFDRMQPPPGGAAAAIVQQQTPLALVAGWGQ